MQASKAKSRPDNSLLCHLHYTGIREGGEGHVPHHQYYIHHFKHLTPLPKDRPKQLLSSERVSKTVDAINVSSRLFSPFPPLNPRGLHAFLLGSLAKVLAGTGKLVVYFVSPTCV